MKIFYLLILILLFPMQPTFAASQQEKEIAIVKNVIAKMMPNKSVVVVPSAFSELYEVSIGPQVYYVSKDGQYFFEGDLYDLKNQSNLTELKRSKGRIQAIQNIDETSMVVFTPKKVKYTVTVFTDIDCGYCRKFHREIESYLEKGIKVRYMAFPRSGKNTPSYFKAVAVWCSSDRKSAMTAAKSGRKVEKKECSHPIDQHLAVGESVGVTGTPTIVMADGKVLPGYAPAEKLAAYLDQQRPKGLQKTGTR